VRVVVGVAEGGRVLVGVAVGPKELVEPTKETTLETGNEKVKLPPETVTAASSVRLSLGPVNQGVTEVVVMPVNEKVWFTTAVPPLMATIVNWPESAFLKAEIETPAEGLAVAEMR
jgi:hypothetical protein